MAQRQGSPSREADLRAPRRLIEVTVAVLGAALSLGTIGFLGYRAIGGPEGPADIVVEVAGIRPAGPGYLVDLIVRNQGPSTGAGVQVEGKLARGGRAVETSEATFDYVPGESERRGGLYFTQDPGRHDLSVRALGLTEP